MRLMCAIVVEAKTFNRCLDFDWGSGGTKQGRGRMIQKRVFFELNYVLVTSAQATMLALVNSSFDFQHPL